MGNERVRTEGSCSFKKTGFFEEAEKEKAELNESYKESVRQTKERKNFHAKAIDGYSE